MVELTGLERMVVLNNHVLRQTLLLLTNKQLQLQLLHLPQIQLPLVQLRIVHLDCRHLLIFGILQLNILASLQAVSYTHLTLPTT